MNTQDMGFNSVVLFERPIIINDNLIYGMFHRDRWIDIYGMVETKLKSYINYLLAVEQITKNGGVVNNAGNNFYFYVPNPPRKIIVYFHEEMTKMCDLLLGGLLKYRIVECPKDTEFTEEEVDNEDYTLITSEELINRFKNLPDPDVLDYIEEYKEEIYDE